MNIASRRTRWANCFLLTIPVLLWNLMLTDKLPPAYQPAVFSHDIPLWLTYGENGLRIIVFAVTLLMPIHITSGLQKSGLLLYTGGLLLYFASWIPLIFLPASSWSHSIPGFMAPAYTPLLWLIGIGLIGNAFYVNIPFRHWYFLAISLLFVLFHSVHTYLIYNRLHRESSINLPDNSSVTLTGTRWPFPDGWRGRERGSHSDRPPAFAIHQLMPPEKQRVTCAQPVRAYGNRTAARL